MTYPSIQPEVNPTAYDFDVPELKVGDRVRVHFTLECDVVPEPGSAADAEGALTHTAERNANGKTGRIEQTQEKRLLGHPYIVQMDEFYEFAGRTTWSRIIAAATELVLLEPDTEGG